MAYSKRYALGFNDSGPAGGTPTDSQFLNNVEAALLALLGVDATADGQALLWKAVNSRYEPALIKNANIDPAAAIARSKLGALGIVDADIAAGANIAPSKILDGIPITKLAGYPADATKSLKGDGTWGKITAVGNVGNKVSDLPAGSDGATARLRVLPTTYNNGGPMALPAGTLTVGDTTGFAASGTLVTPNGSVTYTGKTLTTFTGCAGGAGTLAANAVISQDPATTGADSEYVNLVYDAYQSKWVSVIQTVSINSKLDAGSATANAWVAPGLNKISLSRRWRWYDNAGLKPQARLEGSLMDGGAFSQTNAQIRNHWFSANFKDADETFTDLGSDANSTSNIQASVPGSLVFHSQPGVVTAWSDGSALSVRDQLFLGFDFFCTATTGSNAALDHVLAYLRWVG